MFRAGVNTQSFATDALVFCAVVIGYLVGSELAFGVLSVSDLGAAFFAPSGVSLAAMVVSPRRRWPLVLVAVAATECFVDLQHGVTPGWSIVAFVVANACEPLIGATIIRWRCDVVDLSRLKDLTAFLVGGVVVGPLAAAAIGGATVSVVSDRSFTEVLAAWWLGDGLGVLIVGGALLSLQAAPSLRFSWPEFALGMAMTGSLAFAVHWVVGAPIGFVMIIPVMVMSARLGTRAATAGSIALVSIVLLSWTRGDGFAAGVSTIGGMLLVQLQIATIAAAALLVAAEASELESATRQASYRLETVGQLRAALAAEDFTHARFADAEGAQRAASDLEVGGDWYDVLTSADDQVTIVIGDVVGHDEEALVTMGRLRFAMQAFCTLSSDPGVLIDWLDDYAGRIHGGAYATCFVAHFDPRTGVLRYSSAGHPPALLGLSNGSWQWLSEVRTPPIGVPTVNPRPSAAIEIADRATLVVYTDGVVERAGEIIDSGLARMFDAVVGSPASPVAVLMERLAATTADDASFVKIRLWREGAALPPPAHVWA